MMCCVLPYMLGVLVTLPCWVGTLCRATFWLQPVASACMLEGPRGMRKYLKGAPLQVLTPACNTASAHPVAAAAADVAACGVQVVCVHLLTMLACTDYGSGVVLIADPSIVCWEGTHARDASIALIAFSVYTPLSIMLGEPMLSACRCARLPLPRACTFADACQVRV